MFLQQYYIFICNKFVYLLKKNHINRYARPRKPRRKKRTD